MILKNKILENTDGIILVDSNPLIEKNNISKNKRAGLILSGNSNPKV